MGRGGGEGRVPSFYFFSFVFDVPSMGHSAQMGTQWGLHQPQGLF
jgi:hypothetical protein